MLTPAQVKLLEELGFNKSIGHVYNTATKKQTTRTMWRKLYNRSSYGLNGGCIDISNIRGIQTYFIEGNCDALNDLTRLKEGGIE